ncbi:MAG: rRNA maturation RNase YbeY [Steroidobacteraceae bacterium]
MLNSSTSSDLRVEVSGRRAPDEPAATSVCKWARAALGARGRGQVLAVRYVSLRSSRDLNRRYRGRDRATNVLAFPVAAPDLGQLGDLAVCTVLVRREAAEQAKAVRAHFAHLIVHGCLHLLGLDHRHEREARRMERQERRILRGLGFADPYRNELRATGAGFP